MLARATGLNFFSDWGEKMGNRIGERKKKESDFITTLIKSFWLVPSLSGKLERMMKKKEKKVRE